jgi:hypothetical protein
MTASFYLFFQMTASSEKFVNAKAEAGQNERSSLAFRFKY